MVKTRRWMVPEKYSARGCWSRLRSVNCTHITSHIHHNCSSLTSDGSAYFKMVGARFALTDSWKPVLFSTGTGDTSASDSSLLASVSAAALQ